MKIRRFGRTDFKISQLTFGGGWVGGILIDPDKEGVSIITLLLILITSSLGLTKLNLC